MDADLRLLADLIRGGPHPGRPASVPQRQPRPLSLKSAIPIFAGEWTNGPVGDKSFLSCVRIPARTIRRSPATPPNSQASTVGISAGRSCSAARSLRSSRPITGRACQIPGLPGINTPATLRSDVSLRGCRRKGWRRRLPRSSRRRQDRNGGDRYNGGRSTRTAARRLPHLCGTIDVMSTLVNAGATQLAGVCMHMPNARRSAGGFRSQRAQHRVGETRLLRTASAILECRAHSPSQSPRRGHGVVPAQCGYLGWGGGCWMGPGHACECVPAGRRSGSTMSVPWPSRGLGPTKSD